MGKMKFNPEKYIQEEADFFAPAVSGIAGSVGSTIVTPVAQAVKDTKIAQYNTERDRYNETQHTIQVRYDMVSNIVGDVCGLAGNIVKAVADVNVEKEKTKQVQAQAMANIRVAEEQTEQTRIKEQLKTERKKTEILGEIERKKLQLEEKRLELSIRKEELLHNEKVFDAILATITGIVNSLISNNKELMENSQYFDKIHQNNEQLVSLCCKLADLYKEASK